MGVKWLKAVMMVGFVGVFALATNHCRLEVLKGLEFLVCCSHDDTQEEGHAAPHQDEDCETDVCASLEAGLYKSEDGHVITVAPLAVATVEEFSTLNFQHSTLNSVAEPPLQVSWQFLLRAAAPPRAPSLIS